MAGQSSYVPQEYNTTVLAMVEEAQTEVERLRQECVDAGSKFPSPCHPKAIAFLRAAEELSLVRLDPSLVPEHLQHVLVTYKGQRTRRQAHQMARWCRAGNLSLGLAAAAGAVAAAQSGGAVCPPGLVAMLLEASFEVYAPVFPTLYG